MSNFFTNKDKENVWKVTSKFLNVFIENQGSIQHRGRSSDGRALA